MNITGIMYIIIFIPGWSCPGDEPVIFIVISVDAVIKRVNRLT
jgi:hypothetical protein